MNIDDMWVNKYRPKTLDDYVFKNEKLKQNIEKWVAEQTIPHLLLVGGPGRGKSAVAKLLIKLLEIEEYDILEINASRENNIDTVRNKINDFVSTSSFGPFKIVLLEEADGIGILAQGAMRSMIETYSSSVRWILTANFENKIMDAIKSRMQTIVFDKLDEEQYLTRVITILMNEEIDFEIEDLETVVQASYPDMRKTLNTLQLNSVSGKLILENVAIEGDLTKVVALFKEGRITDARKALVSSVGGRNPEDVYRWMYDNLSLWGDTEDKQNAAIHIIKEGLVSHAIIGDTEIALSSTFLHLCELT